MRVSLTALRVFEAASRHGSLSGGAGELRIGVPAVSRHIAGLESRLGVRLVDRGPRGIALTPDGRDLADMLARAFREIESATARAGRRMGQGGPMTLACDPGLATKWLLPRLPALREAEPELRVRLLPGVPDARTRADVVIRWSRPDEAVSPEVVLLRQPLVWAFTSPHGPQPKTIAALARTPLVHEGGPSLWRRWLDGTGHEQVPVNPDSLIVPDTAMALEAAAAGLGVAVACDVIANDDVNSGRCRRLFDRGAVLGRYVAHAGVNGSTDNAYRRRVIQWLADRMAMDHVAAA